MKISLKVSSKNVQKKAPYKSALKTRSSGAAKRCPKIGVQDAFFFHSVALKKNPFS